MDEELGSTEDISELWGPQPNGLLTPAPRRAGTPPSSTGSNLEERVAVLEREIREAVAAVSQRLDALERQQERKGVRGRLRTLTEPRTATPDRG